MFAITRTKSFVASRELNIPLEINFLGVRDNRIYPNEWFWEVAGRENALDNYPQNDQKLFSFY